MVAVTTSVKGSLKATFRFYSRVCVIGFADEFRLVNGTTLTIQKPSRTFKFSQVAGCNPGTTYQVSVRTYNGAAWSDFGTPCPITTKSAIAGTKIIASQCGATLTNVATDIYANAIINATQYRFRVTNGASVQEIVKASRTFKFSQLPTVHYGATVVVEVDVMLNGSWIGYGDPCNITLPALPTTKLIASQCGITLTSTATLLYADAVSGASQYRFRVRHTNQNMNSTIIKASRVFKLSEIPGIMLDSTYMVDVDIYYNGSWVNNYGTTCNVKTPAPAALILQDNIFAENNNIFEDIVSKEETIELETENSVIANSGTIEHIKLTAFPNPSNGDFTISSSHEGTINIINELGQLVHTVEITKENNMKSPRRPALGAVCCLILFVLWSGSGMCG